MRPRTRRRILFAGAVALLMTANAAAYVPSAQPPQQLPPEPATAAPGLGREPQSARDFERLVVKLDARERHLEKELAVLGPQIELVKKRTMARGRRYYRLMRAGFLPVGGGFDEMVDHATRVERLRAALKRDMTLDKRLRERRKTARVELRRVRAERAPLLLHREAMLRAKSVMQQADDRRAAYQRTFGTTGPSLDGHTAVYGASTAPISRDPLARFASMRGRLSFPLTGRAEVLPGRRGGPLWLKAHRNAAVRAVYPGRVAFAGQDQHGLTIVLDHGQHYYTVYGNLGRVDVRRGDAVVERSRLGWVLAGARQTSALYFELRHGNTVLDAAPWLGL